MLKPMLLPPVKWFRKFCSISGDDIEIHQEEADAMYAGIVVDTNNFMSKTGVRTFEAAAFPAQERR
jgi:c-di-AMP phosphodiesterase-like protein